MIDNLENIRKPYYLGIRWSSSYAPSPKHDATYSNFENFVTRDAIGFCHGFGYLSNGDFGMWLAYFSYTRAMLVEVSSSPQFFYLGCQHKTEVKYYRTYSSHVCRECNLAWRMKNDA